jgi:hypothetical protein
MVQTIFFIFFLKPTNVNTVSNCLDLLEMGIEPTISRLLQSLAPPLQLQNLPHIPLQSIYLDFA